MQLILSNKYSPYLICLLGLIVSLILPVYNLIFSLGLLIILIYLSSGRGIIILVSVVSLLTLTNQIGENLRTAVQIINIILLISLFFRNYGISFEDYPRLPGYAIVLFLLLLTSMAIATWFSDYHMLGVKEIGRTLIFFIIIYCIYSLLINNKDIRILLLSLFIAGIVFSVALIYGFYSNGFNIVTQRLDSNYINVNGWGAYIMIIFSILLSFYMGDKRKSFRIISFFSFIILLSALLITNSRGAILGLIIAILYLFYNFNKKLFITSLLIIILFTALLFINPISELIDLYFRLDKVTTGRDIIWSTIFGIIKDNPILGVGPAATKFYLYNHLTSMLGSPAEALMSFHYGEIEYGHAHNFYLFFWSDLGIAGLITSLFLPFSFFKIGFKNLQIQKNNNREYYVLIRGILASGLGLFVRGIYEWSGLISYGAISQDLPFWLIFIVLWYVNFKEIKREDKILSL